MDFAVYDHGPAPMKKKARVYSRSEKNVWNLERKMNFEAVVRRFEKIEETSDYITLRRVSIGCTASCRSRYQTNLGTTSDVS